MHPPDPGSLVPLQLDGDEAWITRDRSWVWVPRTTLDRLRLSEPTRPKMPRIRQAELLAALEEPPTGTPLTEVDATSAAAEEARSRRLQQAAVWIAISALLVAFASGTWLGLLLRPSADFPYVEPEPEPYTVPAPAPAPYAVVEPGQPPPPKPTKLPRAAQQPAIEQIEQPDPSKPDERPSTRESVSPTAGSNSEAEPSEPSTVQSESRTPRSEVDRLLGRAENDAEGVAAEVKRLRRDNPDDPELLYVAAYAEFKAGRREAARDLYCPSRNRFGIEDRRDFDAFLRTSKLTCPSP